MKKTAKSDCIEIKKKKRQHLENVKPSHSMGENLYNRYSKIKGSGPNIKPCYKFRQPNLKMGKNYKSTPQKQISK